MQVDEELEENFKSAPVTRGNVISLRTPRSRSDDQRANLRRSYQALLRKEDAGEPVDSIYENWPRRPYATSI